jgi:hypothetical protein
MRRLRVTIGLAVVAICALGALAAPAFAKEKIVFGEFQASVTGKNLETESVPLGIFHEDLPTPSIEGLQIGPYKFGPVIRSGPNAGKIDESHPCKVAPKLAGKFQAEPGKVNKSDSLLITLKFRKCITRSEAGTLVHEKTTNFALSFRLEQNFSAEVGTSASGIEIEPTTVSFKGGVNQCPVIIPRQTLPGKDNAEHEYEEIVSFSNESEPVENWEKSKKLKALYPNGLKERLFVEFEEKFKGINAFVKQEGACTNKKGEENPKIDEEGPEGPYKGEFTGYLEYPNGHIFGEIEGLEIRGGELSFVGG